MKKYGLIIVILVFASALRLWRLNEIPRSLYWEEMALGYDAYSILKTGKDFHGNPFPLAAFASFGDYKPSLYFYAIVPFISLFGLNAWAVRLPSALSGVGTVLVLYFLGQQLDKKNGKTIGLLAAAMYAILPWSIHTSRAGFETNLATLLLTGGVLCMLIARRRPMAFLGAAAAFGLSMYAYHATRVVAPLLAFGMFLLQIRSLTIRHKAPILISIVLGLVLMFPLLKSLTNPAINQRAAETSIFADMSAVKLSNTLRAQDGNSLFSRIAHHRYVLMAHQVATQYLRGFDPAFSFLTGDENPRHGTQTFGVMYHWQVVALLAGVYVLIKRRNMEAGVLALWIGISALPQAFTTVSPHVLRFLSAAPAFVLVAAIGIVHLFFQIKHRMRKTMFIVLVSVVAAAELGFFLIQYAGSWPIRSSREWQYGYPELVHAVAALQKPNQRVFVTREQGRPSIAFLFYGKLDPKTVQKADAHAKKDQQELLELGNIIFTDALDPLKPGALYATSLEKRPTTSTLLETISAPDGSPVWELWEVSP